MRRAHAAEIGEQTWQHATDDWLNSMAQGNRRRACRFRCCAKITAEPISFRFPVILSMASGAITNPAARWKQPWSDGVCRDDKSVGTRDIHGGGDLRSNIATGQRPRLSQNATKIFGTLRFGTRCERTTPESADWLRTRLFTARCRVRCEPAHHIQN